MQELNVTLAHLNPSALDRALRQELGTKCAGFSTYGADRPISIWFDDNATDNDLTLAETIASAHDPVFIAANKTRIVADGVDTAIITVDAQNPVKLLIAGVAVSVPLTNGLGMVQLVSNDPTRIEVTVENPANRSTDRIMIEAL